jgi:Fe-S-cluster containining protein
MKRPALDAKEAREAVQAVYAELAARPIQRACELRTECCQFKITGKVPHLTRGEALAAAHALRASGRTRLPERTDGACPLLDASGRCMIYSGRPFGCRTHFCAAAGGPYARREVLDLIRRIEEIDHQTGGDGPRPLPSALRAVL